ncbi:MAG: glycosyltransferase family 2 protein, partial [Acidimicrobiia bacterium]|nr:glycosyltransferase family 2 protein [Acidimicrobiia bacterium]
MIPESPDSSVRSARPPGSAAREHASVAPDALDHGDHIAVCSATTVRAPFEVTWSFVTYHLNLGIDHMYVFLDDPADPAGPRLAELPGVTVVKCDAAHWARLGLDGGRDAPIEARILANTNEAFRRARSEGFDWFVHLDVDELIHVPIGVQRLLDAAPGRIDALLLPLLEAVPRRPDHLRPFEEITAFKSAGLKRNVWRRYRIPAARAPQWNRYQRRLRVARRLG